MVRYLLTHRYGEVGWGMRFGMPFLSVAREYLCTLDMLENISVFLRVAFFGSFSAVAVAVTAADTAAAGR